MRRVSVNTQLEMGQLTTLLSQTFQAARYVKAYGMEDYEERRAAGLFERIYGLIDRANRTRSRAGPMMEALGGVAIALVIFYGGHQVIGSVTLASLRGAIALVSQEVSLFDDTVRANIGYGRLGAPQAQIEAAATAAGADSFIRELPDGYDTLVGEHGVRLSGGQRQRLTIARAMLKDAPILLLDEATSALDSESERQVQTALRSLMRGRTTIVIAHRLSTVIGADL